MKKYVLKKLPEGAGAARFDGEFSPDALPEQFARLNRADLSEFPWDTNGYRPETCAWAGWNSSGIHVIMASREADIRAEAKEVGGVVCTDSCLEFFLMPAPELSGRYFNVEINPAAVMHLGMGDGRHGRTVYSELPPGIDPVASEHSGGWWAVSYTVPADFLKEQFGMDLVSGAAMRGNFYKCGDLTPTPHWGMWQPYDIPRPDYHRPERFGDMELE